MAWAYCDHCGAEIRGPHELDDTELAKATMDGYLSCDKCGTQHYPFGDTAALTEEYVRRFSNANATRAWVQEQLDEMKEEYEARLSALEEVIRT